MTTDLIAIDLDQATAYAEELPNHEQQIELYASAGLTRPEAFSLEVRAAKILTIRRRDILEIGQQLLAAREEAKYGTWGTFLTRCGVEERTAQNYMHAVERFGDKPEMISALPLTSIYALAAPSADPVVVQEIITEVQAGQSAPTVAEIKQRLAPVPTPPPADDGLAHLPADFAQAQARAAKLGLSLSMSTSGRFTLIYDSTRAVASSTETWQDALYELRALEQQAAAPKPTQATLPDADEEIASAAPPPPRPPVALTPLPPALPGLGATQNAEARKLLVSKRMLLQAALQLIETELAETAGPLISFPAERAMEAARLFVAGQALSGAAAMLAFSARVEEGSAAVPTLESEGIV